MAKVIDSTNLGYLLGKIKAAFWRKSEITELPIDTTPTASSSNLVTSGGVKNYVDSAIPSVPVTDVTVGGTSVVSNGTAVIPAIPTIPTIDTSIDNASSNTDTAGAKAVYDAVHPATGSSQPAGGMLPNVMYNLGTLSGNTTFTLASATDNTIVNHYYWTFDTPSTAPTITWPSGVIWVGGSAPTINASKHYEISVLNGVGAFMEA